MDLSPTSIIQAQEWFSLVRYEVTATLSADQWIDQVAKRAVINGALRSEDQNSLDQLLPDLIDAPLADWPFRYRNTDDRESFRCEPVTPLGEKQLERLSVATPSVLALSDFVDQRWVLNEEQMSMSRFGHIRVDMNASDGDILMAFHQWLERYREASTPGLKTKQPSVNLLSETADWHRRGLLPYFDLIAWSTWAKIRLTESDLLALLYPQNFEAPRHILRTLARQSSEVFTMPNVLRLQLRFRQVGP